EAMLQTAPATAALTPPVTPPPATETPTLIPAGEEVKRWPAVSHPLVAGEPVTGTLSEASGVLSDQTPFDLYAFEGRPGQYVNLTLTSGDFDSFLVLVDPDSRILGTNDDANPKDGQDSRLSLPLPASGLYQVWVDSYTGSMGQYTLTLEVQDRSEHNTVLGLGETVPGWLIPGDRSNEDGVYADHWTIEMPDEPWVVWLKSDEFDTRLRALTPDGAIFIENDDLNFVAGDGNSRVVLA